MLKLYNTLTKNIDKFTPLNKKVVTVYSCGPTVYDYAHIGNFRTYVMTDVLVRTLQYNGFSTKFVMNITDVGHLVSDSDAGEDKMEKGARREGKSAWDIAKFFTDAFLSDSKKMGLLEPDVRPKPTEHIPEQIVMVQTLLDKGFAYTIDDGIYFDTGKFAEYGKLTGQNLEELKEGARVEVNPQKKNPNDFAVWKFSYPKGRGFDPSIDDPAKRRQMEWSSPFGLGFPGWHIECSAMSKKYLGDQIDIHAGGADLIPIHHTNEIAQSEAASGKSPFVRYWIHGQFIMVDGEKMSKSKGNFYRLSDIEAKGYEPMALRYLYLSAHYRSFLNFTWEGITGASAALSELQKQVAALKSAGNKRSALSEEKMEKVTELSKKFTDAIENDLNMPQALAVLWEALKSNIPSPDKLELVLDFNRVLGLTLESEEIPKQNMVDAATMPVEYKKFFDDRQKYRAQKEFDKADSARKKLEAAGYILEDTPDGTIVKKNS
jgi:cysteinyl-tRNA synthetase